MPLTPQGAQRPVSDRRLGHEVLDAHIEAGEEAMALV
jgi:hypothetical protein